MSRLEKVLTLLSSVSQCAAAAVDYRANRSLTEELHYTREALRLERDHSARLQQRIADLEAK